MKRTYLLAVVAGVFVLSSVSQAKDLSCLKGGPRFSVSHITPQELLQVRSPEGLTLEPTELGERFALDTWVADSLPQDFGPVESRVWYYPWKLETGKFVATEEGLYWIKEPGAQRVEVGTYCVKGIEMGDRVGLSYNVGPNFKIASFQKNLRDFCIQIPFKPVFISTWEIRAEIVSETLRLPITATRKNVFEFESLSECRTETSRLPQ